MMPAVSPRDRLIARRSELALRVHDTDNPIDAHDVRHLHAVEAALARITAGTYGTCIRCEMKINAARLAAMPEAALCASCASWLEKKRH